MCGRLVNPQIGEREAAESILRYDRNGEKPRFGELGGIGHWVESVSDAMEGQRTLEQHGGRTQVGVSSEVWTECTPPPSRGCCRLTPFRACCDLFSGGPPGGVASQPARCSETLFPPSTTIDWPVTYDAPGLASQATTDATSVAVPLRPTGVCRPS